MAKTAVADVIIPTEFEKYAIERTAELSHFGDSGIVEHDPAFDEIAMQGGREVKMPFWKDLTVTRQLLSDSAPLTVNKIFADQDIARLHNDAQVWSVNHLAKVVSGDDPLQAIVDLVAGYWGWSPSPSRLWCHVTFKGPHRTARPSQPTLNHVGGPRAITKK